MEDEKLWGGRLWIEGNWLTEDRKPSIECLAYRQIARALEKLGLIIVFDWRWDKKNKKTALTWAWRYPDVWDDIGNEYTPACIEEKLREVRERIDALIEGWEQEN